MSLCTFLFRFFFRIVSGNNKTPPQARLGTSVVCCDDDGRFSLLPIRFFFCYGVLLVSRRWLGLTQHTNFSARSLSLSLSRDCVAAIVVIADHRFPLAISVSPFSQDRMQHGRENRKILALRVHHRFRTHCGLTQQEFQLLLPATKELSFRAIRSNY